MRLDEQLRERPKQYNTFCRRMIKSRLIESPDDARPNAFDVELPSLDRYFCSGEKDSLLREQTKFVLKKILRSRASLLSENETTIDAQFIDFTG